MLRRVEILVAFGLVLMSAQAAQAARRVRINVESTPPGATVYVDSEDTAPLGVTPIRAVIVEGGSHTLIFKKDGYETAKLNVNVRRWRETFRAVLDPLSTLVVTPVNDGAQGATLTIDGENKGTLPFQGTLQPGRHFVQVKKDGYKTYAQWHQLQGAQQMTIPILLEKEAPNTGSLLVAGNRPGATIYVDGQAKGVTPTVIEGLSVGQHAVEVRAEGMKPYQETVNVQAGQRAVVSPDFQAPPTTGSLRVVTTPSGALIKVDGEDVGQAPVTAENLSPGDHIVEATLEGHETAQKQVTVEASGAPKVVSMALQKKPERPGKIVVNADVAGATVIVDGDDKGEAPVVVDQPEPGTHAIVVKAPGREEFRTTCEVGPGNDCTINAQMGAVGKPVRVEANVPGAQFYVDGELVGPVPFEGIVPSGSHRVEVRADGYQPFVEQVMLEPGGEKRTFNVALTEVGAKTPEQLAEDRAARLQATREASSYSASPLPQDMTVLDVSMGWPYLVQARLGVGILPFLEAGFAMRTFGRLTEFEGRAKAGYRPIKQIAVGGQFRIGGGIGPKRGKLAVEPAGTDHPTNDFFMSLEALASLHFSQAGAFTLWLAADYSSDRWDWQGGNKDLIASYARQRLWRARLGGSLEVLINRHWNVWGMLEGVVGGHDRRIFGDIFGAGKTDPKLYGRAGFTYKFGIAREEGQTFGD